MKFYLFALSHTWVCFNGISSVIFFIVWINSMVLFCTKRGVKTRRFYIEVFWLFVKKVLWLHLVRFLSENKKCKKVLPFLSKSNQGFVYLLKCFDFCYKRIAKCYNWCSRKINSWYIWYWIDFCKKYLLMSITSNTGHQFDNFFNIRCQIRFK